MGKSNLNDGSRYVHGGWSHIFHDNGPASNLRIVFDRQAKKVVAMEINRGPWWRAASAAEMADVEDSLKNANEEALDDPDAWGLEESGSLPGWAAPDLEDRQREDSARGAEHESP